MLIIRPIKKDDLDALMDLLKDSGHGLTSLPKDRDILKRKIMISERSFEHRGEKAAGESYLLVMEDLENHKIVGVSGIISKIGGFEPYYFYKLHEDLMHSEMLGVFKKVRSLHVEITHSGPAEICSLFLSPNYRKANNGRFLSLSRFLFMAEDRKYFEDKVIAEMRGRVNKDGHSPFWDAVGKKFMDIDFVQADYLTLKSKKFIDELLPKYPILVDLLPQVAQDVVAQVHEDTEPAKRILEKEGFYFSGRVGIFEPGPVLEANLDTIRSIKNSKIATIKEFTTDKLFPDIMIIASSGIDKTFRSTLGQVDILPNDEVRIHPDTAKALELNVGDKIRYVALRD